MVRGALTAISSSGAQRRKLPLSWGSFLWRGITAWLRLLSMRGSNEAGSREKPGGWGELPLLRHLGQKQEIGSTSPLPPINFQSPSSAPYWQLLIGNSCQRHLGNVVYKVLDPDSRNYIVCKVKMELKEQKINYQHRWIVLKHNKMYLFQPNTQLMFTREIPNIVSKVRHWKRIPTVITMI